MAVSSTFSDDLLDLMSLTRGSIPPSSHIWFWYSTFSLHRAIIAMHPTHTAYITL